MSDTKNEGQFPGYPHYPEGEDITNVNNGTHKINVSTGGSAAGQPQTDKDGENDADITAEDRKNLSAAFDTDKGAELDTTDTDGDPLNERTGTYADTGEDLDVPGSEADDAAEDIGAEDEENNYYSLGGDNHIDLEEDQ